MEQQHAAELQKLTGHLTEEKQRMKEELLLQAREAESRVAESRLTELQQEQKANQRMKERVQELAVRQWQSGALGNAVVRRLLACIDNWRHHTLHALMATGLVLEFPEPEHIHPAVEARQRKAESTSRELQRELIFITGMKDPAQLASIKQVLIEHLASYTGRC